MPNKQDIQLLRIVALIHIIGFIGINFSPFAQLFLQSSQFNFYFIALCYSLTLKNFKRKQLLGLFLIFTLGMFIEIIGVKTGFPFGKYNYTNRLGVQLAQVPICIGFNWILVCLGSIAWGKKITPRFFWIPALLLMLLFDALLEPVAIELGYWIWQSKLPPIQNYIAWLIVGFVGMQFAEKYKLPTSHFLKGVLAIQFVFFIGFKLIDLLK